MIVDFARRLVDEFDIATHPQIHKHSEVWLPTTPTPQIPEDHLRCHFGVIQCQRNHHTVTCLTDSPVYTWVGLKEIVLFNGVNTRSIYMRSWKTSSWAIRTLTGCRFSSRPMKMFMRCLRTGTYSVPRPQGTHLATSGAWDDLRHPTTPRCLHTPLVGRSDPHRLV